MNAPDRGPIEGATYGGYTGTRMTREQWLRTREARDRVGLAYGVAAWLALDVDVTDAAVLHEHAEPGASLAFLRGLR